MTDLKPACPSLNVLFTTVVSLASSIQVNTFLGMDKSSMPLQLWQSPKSRFLRSLTIHQLDLYNSVTVRIIYTE